MGPGLDGTGSSTAVRQHGLPACPSVPDSRGLWPVLAQTNPPVRGGVSMDRSVMAALPGTTPRLVRKSSSDGLAWQHCIWALQLFGKGRPRRFSRGRGALPLAWARQAGRGSRPLIFCLPMQATHDIVALARRDSTLEAFRHNPTDGSFAPLATRPSTCTKCPNLRFLSY